jgi:hypothetical protein
MIERPMTPAASALKRAVLAKAGKPYLSLPDEAWEEGVVAVLEAVREPSEEMMDVGDSLAVPDEGYHPGAGPTWIAMIDALIAQERGG